MSAAVLRLAVLVTGVSMLGFQIWAKPRPTPDEIRQYARGIADPAAWHGRVAPDFELTLLDGSTFRISDHVGKRVVILNFFATWCGPCRAEMPELERYQRAHAAEGVMLVGVDVQEKDDVVRRFVAEMQLTFPVGVDGAGDISERYDVGSFPTTVVIGADGRVKLYEIGAIANADVAFSSLMVPELAAIKEGRGITADAYKAALAAEPKKNTERAESTALDGRAKKIAEAMPCPCGCDDKVAACSCNTAKSIKARLARGGYDAKTDVEVMEELNKEFCMKPM